MFDLRFIFILFKRDSSRVCWNEKWNMNDEVSKSWSTGACTMCVKKCWHKCLSLLGICQWPCFKLRLHLFKIQMFQETIEEWNGNKSFERKKRKSLQDQISIQIFPIQKCSGFMAAQAKRHTIVHLMKSKALKGADLVASCQYKAQYQILIEHNGFWSEFEQSLLLVLGAGPCKESAFNLL